MEIQHAIRQLRKDTFISILALISVGIGIYDLKVPRFDAHFTPLDILDLFIVFIFIIDFVSSARSSGNWKRYTKQHWFEIPSLIPVTGNMVRGAETVPILRGLRLVRLVRVVRLLRVIGAVTRMRGFWISAKRIAVRAHIFGLVFFAAMFIIGGALLAWIMEGPVNDRLRGGDSLWWALNMFSNVAYVDFQPVTFGGRLVAAVLEITGIAFIGLFTASLANALLRDKPEPEEKETPLD